MIQNQNYFRFVLKEIDELISILFKSVETAKSTWTLDIPCWILDVHL